jgi:hypothetical protein
VSLRRDQLIPVKTAVHEKEQLENGLEEDKNNPVHQFNPSQDEGAYNLRIFCMQL